MGDLTLDAEGDPAAIFIFQIGTMFSTSASARVLLINGATAANVYWQVASSAVLGASTQLQGTLMADQSVTLGAGVVVVSRVLARVAAVTYGDQHDHGAVTPPSNRKSTSKEHRSVA